MAIQLFLVYGIACDFSNILSYSLEIENLDTAYLINYTEFYENWSAVGMALNWFNFLVFLFVLMRHIFITTDHNLRMK